MPNRIRTALEPVRAEESLKENTRIFLEKRREKAARPLQKSMIRAVAAACCLLLLGAGGYTVYATPVSAVSLEAIPEIQLEINCFDRVISAEGLNEEGKELLGAVSVMGSSYSDAVETLLGSPEAQQWLEGETAVVTVSASSEEKQEKMQETISACETGYAAQVNCYGMNQDLWEEASQAGLSAGKYQAFLEWQSLDPTATVEEAQNLSMREIRERIQACQESEEESDAVSESSTEEPSGQNGGQYGKENAGGNGSQGQNGGHGNGKGYGKKGGS